MEIFEFSYQSQLKALGVGGLMILIACVFRRCCSSILCNKI